MSSIGLDASIPMLACLTSKPGACLSLQLSSYHESSVTICLDPTPPKTIPSSQPSEVTTRRMPAAISYDAYAARIFHICKEQHEC